MDNEIQYLDFKIIYNGKIHIHKYNIHDKVENNKLTDILAKYILEWENKLYPDIISNNSLFTINHHHIISPELLKSITLFEIYEKINTNIIYIDIIPKLKGGSIIDAFKSIIQIGKVFLLLMDIVIWFGKFIAWLVFFIAWLFKFLFYDLIFDFYNSIVVIVVTIFSLPFQILMGIAAFFVNGIGGWITSIFGWDQTNLTKNDKNSAYFQKMDRTHGKKCYLTTDNTVPFSILLGTIVCPPLGVFMDLGITGWFNILICVILTLMYYIPGLIYALFIIYS